MFKAIYTLPQCALLVYHQSHFKYLSSSPRTLDFIMNVHLHMFECTPPHGLNALSVSCFLLYSGSRPGCLDCRLLHDQ